MGQWRITGVNEHPVGRSLRDAAAGRFPPVDGRWEEVPPWRPGIEAVVAFTGHAVLAVAADHGIDLAALGVDGLGGAHHPRVALALAGAAGWIDSLDAVLVAYGIGSAGAQPALVERPDLAAHHRVEFAAAVRDDVQVLGRRSGSALVTLGRGIGGLAELGVELGPDDGPGSGAELITAALTEVPRGDVAVAAVAPGNARALRAFLGGGFRPVASVQLIRPAR